MPPLSRAEAMAVLESGQTELDALFDRLDHEALGRPATIGGGEWAAKDLMGHIAFWEELALNAIDASRAGRKPRVEEFADTDAANAHNHAITAPQSVTDVRARAASTHQALLAVLHGLTEEQWLARPTYAGAKDDTLAELLGGILSAPTRPFGHAWAHLEDLARYVESVHRA
jgi:hypothetical protein